MTTWRARFTASGIPRGGVPGAGTLASRSFPNGVPGAVALASVLLVWGCSDQAAVSATPVATLPDEVVVHFPAGEPILEWASSLAMDGDAYLVADRMGGTVRRYSESGALLASIGRRGDGPEEFSSVQRIEVGPEGQLWVADRARQGLAAFSAEGGLLESRPGGYIPISFAPLSGSRVVVVSAFDGPGLLVLGPAGAVEPFAAPESIRKEVDGERQEVRAVRFMLIPVGPERFYLLDQNGLSLWLVDAPEGGPTGATAIAPPADIAEAIIRERDALLASLPSGRFQYTLLSDAWDADAEGRLVLKLAAGPLLILYDPDEGWTALEAGVHPREGLTDIELHEDRLALLYETEVRIVELPDGSPPQADPPTP